MDQTAGDQMNPEISLGGTERSEGSPTWDKHEKEVHQEGDLHKNQDGAKSKTLKDNPVNHQEAEGKKNTQKVSSSRVLKFSEYFS
jgi:hypothetical protein